MSGDADRRASTDQQVEAIMGHLLRTGVTIAAVVVAIGALIYLFRHGTSLPAYQTFQGEPADLRSVKGILLDTLTFRGRGIIQFGLLLLVATPIARVIFSLVTFLRQRDWLYVAFTAVVLVVLGYSLLGQA